MIWFDDDNFSHRTDLWVEDVKGVETPAFKKNKRLWRSYGRCLLVVKTRRNNRWINEMVEPDGEKTIDSG